MKWRREKRKINNEDLVGDDMRRCRSSKKKKKKENTNIGFVGEEKGQIVGIFFCFFFLGIKRGVTSNKKD